MGTAGEKGTRWESGTIPVAVCAEEMRLSMKIGHWETEKAKRVSQSPVALYGVSQKTCFDICAYAQSVSNLEALRMEQMFLVCPGKKMFFARAYLLCQFVPVTGITAVESFMFSKTCHSSFCFISKRCAC